MTLKVLGVEEWIPPPAAGFLEFSKTYGDLDISQLKEVGDTAECFISQVIEPGKADRFGITLSAKNLPVSVDKAWNLLPTLHSNFGSVVGKPVVVRLSGESPRSRAQDQELQAYLDEYLDAMESLLLNEGLLNSPKGDEARELALYRTRMILSLVDSGRKRSVVQFLYESQLIQSNDPVVKFHGAPLDEAYLSNADLSNANLAEAYLSRAFLEQSNLDGANLSNANLFGANLFGADLSNAELYNADLKVANLSSANLSGANLSGANLSGAILRDTNLGGAYLSGADLSNARGVTDEQLANTTTVVGAIMPDGSTHD